MTDSMAGDAAPAGPAAYSRGHRSWSTSPEHPLVHPLVKMPSEGVPTVRKSSVGGVAQLRNYWPMVVMLVMLALMLISTSIKVTNSAPPASQQLSQTMEQLSNNQAAMMQMLQQLAANKSAAPEQHQQQVTKNQAEMLQMLQQLAATNKIAPSAELSKKQAEMIEMLQQLAASKSAPTEQQQPEQQQQQQKASDNTDEAAELPAAFAAIPELTTLHNKLLRSSHSYEQHRTTMKATLDKLVHMSPDAALALINTQLKQHSGKHAEAFTYRLYKLLLSSEKLIPCREDTTLVVNDPHFSATPVSTSSHPAHPHFSLHMPHFWHQSSDDSARSAAASAPHPKYYFATNLRDNSVNMPQYILSLLQTLLQLPQDHVFVSAYESNSDDGAHGWIDILQLALNVIGTPSRLVTRGMLVRLEGTHRIEFLARVRNMALAPLYQRYAADRNKQIANATTGSLDSSSNTSTARIISSGRRSVLADASSISSSMGSAPFSEGSERRRRLRAAGQLESLAAVDDTADLLPGVLPWDPDYIVFVNDVNFCASQVLRLMNYQADITCGMDYWQNPDATQGLSRDQANKGHKPKPRLPAEYKLERPIDNPMGPDQSNPIVFYDVWVSRDLSGSKFWWNHPFVHDRGTSHASAKGLPLRASCCWNGLTVIKAAPFKAGLKIRSHMQGECMASECTLLCHDMARLGYDYVVVDAGVQITYDWDLAREMMAVGVEGVGQSTWAQAKAAGIAGHDRKPNHKQDECCDLKGKWVSFYTDCHKEDIFATNWTQKALQGKR